MTQRSETERSETQRSETQRSETQRSETPRSETERSETQRSGLAGRSAGSKRTRRFPVAVALFVVVASATGTAVAYQQTSAGPTGDPGDPGGEVASGMADSAVASAAQDAGAGQAVYDANCASCHQPGGVGMPGTFPPLAGNPNAADPAHVETVVRDGLSGPIEVNGETYNGVMPAVPGLSDTELADVVAYVTGLAEGGGGEAPPPAPPPAEGGDVAAGKAMFTGETGLTNGGGACVGCHVAGSVGNLGGPVFGPDLTAVASRLGGEAGLSAWLSNPPSPTMMPIFAGRPLTPEEIADLTAFLVDAPDQKAASQSVDWLIIAAGIGLVVLMAGMAIAYRGMRKNYKERLVARTAARGGTRARRGAAQVPVGGDKGSRS